MNQALSFGLLGVGGLALTKALTGSSWADVVKGHPGSVPDTGSSLTVAGAGTAITTAAASSTAPATPSAGGGAAVHGSITSGDLESVAKLHGWNASDIAAWLGVITAESNGTITDTNSSSGAYGIAQFINGASEYAQYGGNSTTVIGQLTSMANYIEQRYGTPSAALAHENAYHWY